MATIGPFAVHVHDSSGKLHSFLPGESVPEWAAKLMGPHCFTGGAAPTSVASHQQPVTIDTAGDPGPDGDGPPPQAGPGASRDVWAAYGQAHGVNVGEDWKRERIIAACRAAGVAIE
jgi:hypothetical protein